MAPDVSIVVLFSREAEMAARCLDAVSLALEPGIAVEHVLVLNAVGDETKRAVQARAPEARIVESPVNTGTNAGWNLALAAARGRYVALLHEDSEPQHGWLGALLRTAEADPRVGVVGSRLVEPDGGFQSAGVAVWPSGVLTVLDAARAPAPLPAAPFAVDSVASAGLLLDRELWERVGGFDERFFPAMYTEHDFCVAAWRAGRTVLLDPASAVRHGGEAMVRPERGARGSRRFREFLWRRAAERLKAKWGTALDAFGRLGVDAVTAGRAEHAAALERAAARAAAPASFDLPAPDRSLTAPDGVVPSEPDAAMVARFEAAQRAVEREFADWLLQKLEAAEEGLRWSAEHRERTQARLDSRERLIAELQDALAAERA